MAHLIERIEALVTPILTDLGCELVDIEYQQEQRGWVLRFLLDKEGGINLDACAAASREIGSLLDVEDVIPTAFNLEVSSPGLERPLKKAGDFERFSGQPAKIKTVSSIDPDESGKNRKTFIGTLSGFDNGDVLLQLKKDGDTIRIALHLIDKANLIFEF
ncbi:MAG: ribosome maturation factor RimP [Desulfuromonadales bacterium]|nr:ribosome maturation factor RimP [Desulfuromonadales bacterium]